MPRRVLIGRLGVATGIGLVAGAGTFATLNRWPGLQGSDFTYPWLASRAVLHGLDPYAAVAHSVTPWGGGWFYSFPAALIALPFSGLPAAVAAACFIGVGSAWLTYRLLPRGAWALLVFASAQFVRAAATGQWSPLLTAAALTGPAIGLAVAKPNVLLPLLAMQRSWTTVARAALVGLLLFIISFLLSPRWPLEWAATLRDSPFTSQYRVPALTLLGAPLWLAGLRWRDWRGRLLLAMALVPQNAFLYEQLPLLLIAQTRAELLGMVLASWVVYSLTIATFSGGPIVAESHSFAPLMIVGLYWPALLVLLRPHSVRVSEDGEIVTQRE